MTVPHAVWWSRVSWVTFCRSLWPLSPFQMPLHSQTPGKKRKAGRLLSGPCYLWAASPLSLQLPFCS